MTQRGLVLDSGTVRMEYVVTAAESDGALHEMRVTYAAGSPFPPSHLHPAQDERFEVHEGVMVFLVDGVEHVVGAGEAIDLPRGCVHQARNPGEEPAVVTWQTRPALRTGEFFAAMDAARTNEGLDGILRVIGEFGDVFCFASQPEAAALQADG